MKSFMKHSLLIVLVLSMLAYAVLPAYAAREEEYLSDLRIIYANDYDEAKQILSESSLEGYRIYNANLNENTGKIGVWLAYQTTADIENAITDIAVMQMNGGYKEGNYQEMIAKSYAQYVEVGATYLQAIEYFIQAYNAGDFLASSAYRQLNLYTVKTEGIDNIPAFEGERIGDIFYDGIEATDLATMFMEGNSYAMNNIRSLLAMGVSYNEDGKHYLEKVSAEAAAMTADPDVYANENYLELASLIAGNVLTFGSMFAELAAYESELDYTDEEFTDLELSYAQYQSLADRMREIPYLNGQTLYDFCLAYEFDREDLTSLYPLVAALNQGQEAMTRVSHYYDVVLYSMTDLPKEKIEEELAALEQTYCDVAFNIYAGMDRTIYQGTFALTDEATRASAYTESGFWSFLSDPGNAWGMVTLSTAGVSLFCSVWAICRSAKASMMTTSANNALESAKFAMNEEILKSVYQTRNVALIATAHESLRYSGTITVAGQTFDGNALGDTVVNAIFEDVFPSLKGVQHEYPTKILMLKNAAGAAKARDLTPLEDQILDELIQSKNENYFVLKTGLGKAQETAKETAQQVSGMTKFTHALYVVGGITLLVSAITLGVNLYNYYHPTYDDIPLAMVDIISTVDGDRYIKYDVVLEAEEKKNGSCAAADLNAFSAQRWNALYYTKSYDAGKPLLADEFVISTASNMPDKNYAPVHRFGEVVCYNLNRYNFNEKHSIYLSIKQSQIQKSAVADLPEIIGAVFSKGFGFIAGGVGVVAGVGGVLAMQRFAKQSKKKNEQDTSK